MPLPLSETEKGTITHLVGEVGEMRGQLLGISSSQDRSEAETHRLRVTVDTVVASEQARNVRLSSLEEHCKRTHRKDTDEHDKVAGLTARVEVAEGRINDIEPRFDVTETSVVEVQTEVKTRRQVRELAWKRAAQVVGLLSGGAGLQALIQWLC